MFILFLIKIIISFIVWTDNWGHSLKMKLFRYIPIFISPHHFLNILSSPHFIRFWILLFIILETRSYKHIFKKMIIKLFKLSNNSNWMCNTHCIFSWTDRTLVIIIDFLIPVIFFFMTLNFMKRQRDCLFWIEQFIFRKLFN